jgi:hypothetical protein
MIGFTGRAVARSHVDWEGILRYFAGRGTPFPPRPPSFQNMKLICAFLLATSLACAAQKRYVVCIIAGDAERCTKPLTKEASEAVFDVFARAPLQGIDAVYLADTKAKTKNKDAAPPASDRPAAHPPEPLGPTIKL